MTLRKSLTTIPFDFEIIKGLIFYKNEQTKQNLAVMFKHDKGRFHSPEPFSKEQLYSLLPDEEKQDLCYQPNTLYYSADKMVWWVKGGMRYLDVVDKPRKQYRMPRLLFKVQSHKLFVAAFKGEPTDDTPLFAAPFRGIDVHGEAMGSCNVRLPKTQKMKDRDQWEDAFFMSAFNQEPKYNNRALNKTISEFIFCY